MLLDSLDGVPCVMASKVTNSFGCDTLRWNAIEHWDLSKARKW